MANKQTTVPPIGIDLGTTLSGAAVFRKERCEMIPNPSGDRLTPSVVYFKPDSLDVLVGKIASSEGIRNRTNLLFDVKRIIGRKFDDVYVQNLINRLKYDYKIVKGENENAVIELIHDEVTVQKTPEQISSEVLKHIKEYSSVYLNGEVTEAVISVPAYFSNAQRKATKAAAELAGLKVLKLITEPVAAAMHYSQDRLEKPATLLVFDFGGGTLDISIIKVDDKKFRVQCVRGDTFLGGRDIDQILVEHFKSQISDKLGSSILEQRILKRLDHQSIKMKIILSTQKETAYLLDYVTSKGDDFELKLTRDELNYLVTKLYSRAETLLTQCLQDVKLKADDITDVLLVGGSSRIPFIKDLLSSIFGPNKICTDCNPDEAVALGSALQAALFKKNLKNFEKYDVIEVTPLPLGVSCFGQTMNVLIKKNTSIPCRSNPSTLTNCENNSGSATFYIYEGERKKCKFNNEMGLITLNDLPRGKAGSHKYEITFVLDLDGILQVEAVETTTGISKKVVVTLSEFRLCEQKLKEIADDAEIHKIEDDVHEAFANFAGLLTCKCNEILYDLDKVIGNKRSFVRSKCTEMLEIIEKYWETANLPRLVASYDKFKHEVQSILNSSNIDILFDELDD